GPGDHLHATAKGCLRCARDLSDEDLRGAELGGHVDLSAIERYTCAVEARWRARVSLARSDLGALRSRHHYSCRRAPEGRYPGHTPTGAWKWRIPTGPTVTCP